MLKDIDPVGGYNVKGLSACNPQVEWLKDEEIDFIGRVEHFQRDIDYVLERLELPKQKMLVRNKSKHTKYRDYYCPESKRIVEDFYREDFERFGY